jgi:hypothetical protein
MNSSRDVISGLWRVSMMLCSDAGDGAPEFILVMASCNWFFTKIASSLFLHVSLPRRKCK